MFQRIRGAIDQRIADEQARQKVLHTDTASTSSVPSRHSGSSSRNGNGKNNPQVKGRKAGKSANLDVNERGSGATNPDPAIFEAAFVIDDNDDLGGTSTPPIATPSINEAPQAAAAVTSAKFMDSPPQVGELVQESTTSNDRGNGPNDSPVEDIKHGLSRESAAPTSPGDRLPTEILSRLRKLDKLEATYPELLRSYRIAHGRATSIEPFEKALRENTPLTSIRDPDALVEYLNQLNLKSDMVMDELKRVSAERDGFKKTREATDRELSALKDDLALLKSERESSVSKVNAAEQSISSLRGSHLEEVLSFEGETPQLKSQFAQKSEEVERLKAELVRMTAVLSSTNMINPLPADQLNSTVKQDGASGALTTDIGPSESWTAAESSEVASLTERLQRSELKAEKDALALAQEKASSAESRQEQETVLATLKSRNVTFCAEIERLTESNAVLQASIKEASLQIEELKAENAESLARAEQISQSLSPPTISSPVALGEPPTPQTTAAKKKKSKKKKKAGPAGTKLDDTSLDGGSNLGNHVAVQGQVNVSAENELIIKLKDEVAQKDEVIARLTQRKKSEEDLKEEIEDLRDNLLDIGQDHVEAKERIKALEGEKAVLMDRITELDSALDSYASTVPLKMQSEFDDLERECKELKSKLSSVQSDLGAAQQLAQTRYRDLVDLREVMQKAQPELKALRQDSAALKAVREELAARASELHSLEKREKESKLEITKLQRLTLDRESEIKSLREKITAETNQRLRLEDDKRVAGRDLRRAEAEKIELSAREEKAAREVQKLQGEMARLQPRVMELEEEAFRLRKEHEVLRGDAELKVSQYAGAQNLLGSMRDQTAELSIQLKESQAQAESLDEELAECRKLLGERTREAETMRRLLADVDDRTEGRVREMRVKLDAAVEERDRLEDESSALARRKARETEELRSRVRDLEREFKDVALERDSLEQQERDWRRRREELEAFEARAEAEVAEMRSTVSSLRMTLDTSEQQVREVDKQKADLRRVLDDLRQRYEKLAKEAKAKLNTPTTVPAGSGRSSVDSNRSGTNGSGTPLGGADVVYLKTILLQFLEQKDNKLRAQLVPVLAKLLRFDRSDEQKWTAAVQQIGTR